VILVGLTARSSERSPTCAGSKKAFLAAFVAVGVLCSFGLYFSTPQRWALALTVFVIGNIAVTASLAFYNALLPRWPSTDEVDRVSTGGVRGRLPGGRPAAGRRTSR
jgi:MFS-type transporter involved in bile tolerance (Atg22 family)